jgi:hypothetical protein
MSDHENGRTYGNRVEGAPGRTTDERIKSVDPSVKLNVPAHVGRGPNQKVQAPTTHLFGNFSD